MLARFGAGVGLLALAAFLAWMYGNARFKAGQDFMAVKVAEATATGNRLALDSYAQGVAAGNAKVVDHVEWRDHWLTPAKETITKEIVRYAQTPSGAAVCFDADGVRRANQDISTANQLASPAPSSGSAGTMPSPATDRDAGGRQRDPRPSQGMDREVGLEPGRVRTEAPAGDRDVAQMIGDAG